MRRRPKWVKWAKCAKWPTGETQTRNASPTELKNAIATVLRHIDFLVGLILKAQG